MCAGWLPRGMVASTLTDFPVGTGRLMVAHTCCSACTLLPRASSNKGTKVQAKMTGMPGLASTVLAQLSALQAKVC